MGSFIRSNLLSMRILLSRVYHKSEKLDILKEKKPEWSEKDGSVTESGPLYFPFVSVFSARNFIEWDDGEDKILKML